VGSQRSSTESIEPAKSAHVQFQARVLPNLLRPALCPQSGPKKGWFERDSFDSVYAAQGHAYKGTAQNNWQWPGTTTCRVGLRAGLGLVDLGMMLLRWGWAGGGECSWRLNQACCRALSALIRREGVLQYVR